MNDHGYTAQTFLAQLPRVLAEDSRMAALATAIAHVLADRLSDLSVTEIYNRIDELPEAVLDILAYDFKVDWYNFDYPVEAKRNLIKSSFTVHKQLGTAGAVKDAISSIYPRSGVEEWFNYGGSPYCFIVALEAGYPIIPVATNDVLRAVYLYKSMRSHLDAIAYRTTTVVGIGITTGYVKYWGRITGTYPSRARLGRIVEEDIQIGTSVKSAVYTNPLTGEVDAGTFPARAVQGEIAEVLIQLDAESQGTVYRTPNAGEIESGTFPARAVQGEIVPGSIDASASGEGLAYNARLCGTAPGGIL